MEQWRILMKNKNKDYTQAVLAAKAGVDIKTAVKYLNSGLSPDQSRPEHTWRTREDSFAEVWDEVCSMLISEPGLEAKTIFEHLKAKYPGIFSDGQLRTLQRRIKSWRVVHGSAKEVFFPQVHTPGDLCASDYTSMDSLGITINRNPFDHLVYHFVLTYSNWETGTVCYSESFESLSAGFQNALWSLGGIPGKHRTDRLSAAVNNNCCREKFTVHYEGLLSYYGIEGQKIQAGKANENGDVEQRHYRFKTAVDQALMLRGSRDFASLEDYEVFLKGLFDKLNSGRRERFEEELKCLKPLPEKRLEDCKFFYLKVGPSSTINVAHNTYSVDSRLIGAKVEVRLYAERLEIWHCGKNLENIPRMRGQGGRFIQYRHIIDSLVRKPGAFDKCKYFPELFPTTRFKIAFDSLRAEMPLKANSQYLKILHLAAYEGESKVDAAIANVIETGGKISFEEIETIVKGNKVLSLPDMKFRGNVNLVEYDGFLTNREAITQ